MGQLVSDAEAALEENKGNYWIFEGFFCMFTSILLLLIFPFELTISDFPLHQVF